MKNTRKIMLLAIAVILCAGAANAELRFGIRAGLNVNKLKFSDKVMEDALNPENSCGWNAGVTAEYMIPLIGLGFDASLLYSRMNNGADNEVIVKNPDGNEYTTTAYGKNFIEIPVNLKYKFSLPVVGSVMKPYLYTGPTFAFKLDKNTISSLKTRTCQMAWNVGLGIELVKHLQVQASYGFGLNNIAENWVSSVAGVNTTNVKLRNNYWTVGLGYMF